MFCCRLSQNSLGVLQASFEVKGVQLKYFKLVLHNKISKPEYTEIKTTYN